MAKLRIRSRAPSLVPLTLPHQDAASFWVLGRIAPSPANRAVIFLHGLGENRSGLNYLFSELSSQVYEAGWSTYRFDLAGCGDSLLPLDLDLWKAQLRAVRMMAKGCSTVAIVCRGAGCCAVPRSWALGPVIALAPAQRNLFEKSYRVVMAGAREGWIRPRQGRLSADEQQFWTNLGVEVGCIGGLVVPAKFLWHIRQALNQPRPSRIQILPGSASGLFLDASPPRSRIIVLQEADPLFALARDRSAIAEKLCRILGDS